MRALLAGLALTALTASSSFAQAPAYGLIGRMTAKPGQRDALVQALVDGSRSMPGCISYIVAKDAADPDAIWVSEAWRSQADHDASLALPQVKAAITRGRPLIATFGERHETIPATPASPG
ncbi:hypothetical protein BH09PSE2_BH09PSE2_25560 [soil metagenome]